MFEWARFAYHESMEKREGAWEIVLVLPDFLVPQSLLVFAISLLSFMTSI